MATLPTTNNKNSRGFYVGKIGGALSKSVEGFIEAGHWLIEAKEELPHGEFEKMVVDDLQMSPQTARKLKAIAEHAIISNRSHARDLPPSWDTLYRLTMVEPKVLQAAIKDGRVNPKMKREEVAALLPNKNAGPKPKRRKNDRLKEKLAASLVLDDNKSYEQAAAETGVGSVQVIKTAVAREEGRREAKAEPEIDLSTLAMSAQQKLEAAIRQHKRKLDLEFEQRVIAECRKRIEETILPSYTESYALHQEIIKARKGIMDRSVYRKILSCLHPDRVGAELKRRYEDAFHLFTQLEKVLLDEKQSPTTSIKMPSTYEEMMALKRKASEARKAKRGSGVAVRP